MMVIILNHCTLSTLPASGICMLRVHSKSHCVLAQWRIQFLFLNIQLILYLLRFRTVNKGAQRGASKCNMLKRGDRERMNACWTHIHKPDAPCCLACFPIRLLLDRLYFRLHFWAYIHFMNSSGHFQNLKFWPKS